MKYVRVKLQEIRRCSLLVMLLSLVTNSAQAYVPKVVHAEGMETSIDGELYEDSAIMTFRTPARFYHYKALEDNTVGEVKACRDAAEKWAIESLPQVDTINGLIKKVRLAGDDETMKIQAKFSEMLQKGRSDIIDAYCESLRLNADVKTCDAVVAYYKSILKSRNWKALGERDSRKKIKAFKALRDMVMITDMDFFIPNYVANRITVGKEEVPYFGNYVWEFGELQKKIDALYANLSDLKRARIAKQIAEENVAPMQEKVVRQMKRLELATKKNVNASKRAARRSERAATRAEESAADAASSAASAAASASSASGSAAAAEESARRAANSANDVMW